MITLGQSSARARTNLSYCYPAQAKGFAFLLLGQLGQKEPTWTLPSHRKSSTYANGTTIARIYCPPMENRKRRLLKRLLTGLTYTIGAYEYVLPPKEHSLVLNRSLGCG